MKSAYWNCHQRGFHLFRWNFLMKWAWAENIEPQTWPTVCVCRKWHFSLSLPLLLYQHGALSFYVVCCTRTAYTVKAAERRSGNVSESIRSLSAMDAFRAHAFIWRNKSCWKSQHGLLSERSPPCVCASEADGQANHVRVTVHTAATKRVSVFAFS